MSNSKDLWWIKILLKYKRFKDFYANIFKIFSTPFKNFQFLFTELFCPVPINESILHDFRAI